MGNTIRLHYPPHYDRTLAPVPAERYKPWWDDNARTRNHARHCLPLTMANSLGYYILSPGTFLVEWNGDEQAPAQVQILEPSSHCVVDNHAAFGSFTVQAVFIPVTDQEGDFVYIKGMPNERGLPYSCMEACIEAWWSVAEFGLVYLLNRPGRFLIRRGQPIAQMLLLRQPHPKLEHVQGMPARYAEWKAKRARPTYRKDFDYMTGRYPDGCPVSGHTTNWKASDQPAGNSESERQ